MTAPDGTVTTAQLGPDPRWGMRAPIPSGSRRRTPGGRTKLVTRERSVELDDPVEPVRDRDAARRHDDRRPRPQRGATTAPRGRSPSSSAEGRASRRPLRRQGPASVEQTRRGGPRPAAAHVRRPRAASTSIGRGRRRRDVHLRRRAPVPGRDADRRREPHDAPTPTTTPSASPRSRLPSGRAYGFTYDDNGNRTAITMPDRTPAPSCTRSASARSARPTSYTPPGSLGVHARVRRRPTTCPTLDAAGRAQRREHARRRAGG